MHPSSGSGRAPGHQDPFDRPADAVLWALRRRGLDYRLTGSGSWRWVASCPSCTRERPALLIHEHGPLGGPVSLRCANGCTEARILAALADDPQTPVERLLLDELIAAWAADLDSEIERFLSIVLRGESRRAA